MWTLKIAVPATFPTQNNSLCLCMARNGRTLIRRLIVRRISIYALDLSQGLFIVLEAYNSGLK